ncbi:hypothetical protein RM697_11545 [Ichthyenterobacterium sp. W332]|uniref:Uncharacterized protein n=1 Tax=Microcosmobacter mediterraneus TaxID=3075607 RepID=A0ABU2YNM9_9FLAO|nr:hypothetical protein [Ichthyenterobacterium sp. W332]MDT0559289.1 hypothetical protein [Ichthyenterobacterium sp. W332]
MLILSELVLPEKEIQTTVVSKDESYRARFGTTTYNIYFENLNDQFNKEVFDHLMEGEEVLVNVSFFSKEISTVTSIKTGITHVKETSEEYFLYGLALVFILTSLIWLKPRMMSAKEARILAILIFISAFSLLRILKHL